MQRRSAIYAEIRNDTQQPPANRPAGRTKTARPTANCSVTLAFDKEAQVFSGSAPAGTTEEGVFLEKRMDGGKPEVVGIAPTVASNGRFRFELGDDAALDAGDKENPGHEVRALVKAGDLWIESGWVKYAAKTEPVDSPIGPLAEKANTVRGALRESNTGQITVVVRNRKKQVKDQVVAVVNGDGTFAAALKPGITLACNDSVELMPSGAMSKVTCPAPDPPRLIDPREGDGHLRVDPGDSKTIKIDILSDDTVLLTKTVKADAASDISIEPRRLAAGDLITVTGLDDSGNPIADTTFNVPSSELDWGRVRAYFTGGVEVPLSRDKEGKSNFEANASIGANLDYNFIRTEKFRLHTFFESRLSSVGVSDTSFKTVTSLRSANLQAGLYAPIVTSGWRHANQRQTLFVAPLLKSGLYVPVEDLSARGSYPFWTGGFRVGHFIEPGKRVPCVAGPVPDVNRAPELISYIDFSFGRFNNLPASNPLGNTVRNTRMMVEGYLKIPKTPFVAGFNTNIAITKMRDFVNPPNDFRLLIGTRFDISRVLGRFVTFNTR